MWDWEGLKRGLNCAVKGRKRSQDERLAPCGFLGQSPEWGLGQGPKVLPQARSLRRRLCRREPGFGVLTPRSFCREKEGAVAFVGESIC